jgi:cell division protein FtsB
METAEAVTEASIDLSATEDMTEEEMATLQNGIDTTSTIEDESVKAYARKLIGRQ